MVIENDFLWVNVDNINGGLFYYSVDNSHPTDPTIDRSFLTLTSSLHIFSPQG